MKKIFFILCVALISVSAFAQKGKQSVGVGVNYGTEISNIGLGAKYQYGLTDALRLEGGFDYFLKKDGVNMWDINLNAHYLFPLAEKFKVYPLAGLTYTRWGIHDVDYDLGEYSEYSEYSDDDLDTDGGSTGKFGVNLGAGLQYDLSEKLAVNAEIKYQLISDFNQVVFGVGVAYKF